MATPTVYVICDQNCKFEGMTKEQILAAIAQAVETGEIKDVDTGFVQTIKTINGLPLRFFVGEQSAYDALTSEEKKDLFAIITNDTTIEGIRNAIEQLQKDMEEIKKAIKTLQETTKDGAHVTSTAFPIGSILITKTSGFKYGEDIFTTHRKNFYYVSGLRGLEHIGLCYEKEEDLPKQNGVVIGENINCINGIFRLLGEFNSTDNKYLQLWQKVSD